MMKNTFKDLQIKMAKDPLIDRKSNIFDTINNVRDVLKKKRNIKIRDWIDVRSIIIDTISSLNSYFSEIKKEGEYDGFILTIISYLKQINDNISILGVKHKIILLESDSNKQIKDIKATVVTIKGSVEDLEEKERQKIADKKREEELQLLQKEQAQEAKERQVKEEMVKKLINAHLENQEGHPFDKYTLPYRYDQIEMLIDEGYLSKDFGGVLISGISKCR